MNNNEKNMAQNKIISLNMLISFLLFDSAKIKPIFELDKNYLLFFYKKVYYTSFFTKLSFK